MNPLPIIYTGLLTERSAAAFPVFKAMLLPPGTSISMPLKKLLMPSVAEEKDPTMLLIIARTSAPMPVKMAPTTARYTPASQPQRFAAPADHARELVRPVLRPRRLLLWLLRLRIREQPVH